MLYGLNHRGLDDYFAFLNIGFLVFALVETMFVHRVEESETENTEK